MNALIRPGTARGTVPAPPSKSMAHRLLICAALADRESIIRGVDPSEDILATADCLAALGASLSWERNTVRVRGFDPRNSGSVVLRCRESGSTLRFMIPLCLLSGSSMRLEGSETLLSRPLSVYEDLCRDRGFLLSHEGGGLLSGNSTVRLIPPVESRSYLALTLQALQDAGVNVTWTDEYTLSVPGNSVYSALDTVVEGDYSNAAFFEAFNCICNAVTVTGLRNDSLQGDRVYRDYFARLKTGPAELDLTDCPDLAPVLFSAAALCHGAVFTGTRRLRFKESDRGAVMAEELAKFGIILETEENRITVPAGMIRVPEEPLDSHNDHRIAMALSLLCTRTGGVIRGAEAVRKSFPDYWDRLRSLGISVTLQD